jgi:ABC-type antimicrobial peptide transport system permease subunit
VLLVLAGAAVVALALALVGLALGLVADLRDEQGELFDLESQGAAPATLRSHLRLRAAAVGAAGALGGVLLGLVLAALVVDLVTLAADAAQPEPPLRLVLGWPVALAGLAVLAVLGGLLAVTLTRRAFAARAAGRWTEVGT